MKLFKEFEDLPQRKYHLFLSSGTTQSHRSRSYFTSEGLNLYKVSSIISFHDFLKRSFWEEEDLFSIPGVSLIPQKKEWPQSSLAQMISWFSDFWHLNYFNPQAPEESFTHTSMKKPMWVYGTAFHFVNLYDSGFKVPLPSGSIIIETGGTKGKSRKVSQSELKNMISKMFGVHEALIFSEYSMCEMASQAYSDQCTDTSKQKFSFPFWTKTYVMEKNGIL